MVSKLKILNTEPLRFKSNAFDNIRNLCELFEYESDREYLLKNIINYDAILIGLKNIIDKEILKKGEKLKCIITPTTGLNHIDIDFAKDLGIKVLSLKGETDFLKEITATAELTMALILSLVRKVNSAHKSVINCKWERDEFKGKELKNMTLGVIGFGRLGSMVAKYGEAFDMKILVNDINPNINCKYEQVNLEKLVSCSDIISVHIPLNRNNINFLDSNKLSKFKKGSIFINTSRGNIVDENCLVKLIESNHLSGLGLDVLADEFNSSSEWLKENKLRKLALKYDSVLLTPHIGGLTYQSADKANAFIIKKLESFLRTYH